MPSATTVTLREIQVDGLFGHSPPLKLLARGPDSPSRRLMLLYGDNGSGKTTILELLFHALAPAQNKRHRMKLLRTKFSRLFLRFDDGGELEILRSHQAVDGPYSIRYTTEKLQFEAKVSADARGVAVAEDEALAILYSRLAQQYAMRIYYIPENRRHIRISAPHHEEEIDTNAETALEHGRRGADFRPKHQTAQQPVEWILERFAQWLRRRALETVQAGGITAHDAVRVALQRIARGQNPSEHGGGSDIGTRLNKLNDEFKRYEKFGMAPAPDLSSLSKIIAEAAPPRRIAMQPIVEPYLESLEARVRTYARLISRLTTFAGHLSNFLANKSISVGVYDGVVVRAPNGEILSPEVLSSGERQILLLLISGIIADAPRTVFIIDEPEISLNIRWQRQLLRALLDCTDAQFVLATHSVEIVAPYADSITQIGSGM